jgi:Trk K+ transport system NAD-binding subunit
VQADAPSPEVTVELPGPVRHFVVCGDTPLAYRLVDELVTQYDAHVTAIFPPNRTTWAERISQTTNVTVVESPRLDQDAFTRAELIHAEAIALVDQEDAGNVEAALLAREINPDARIVIRMFNLRLGERMSELLSDCAVLSAAAIAAPAFVAAAMDEAATVPIKVADRTLIGVRLDRTRPEDIVCGLAVMGPKGAEAELLPTHDEQRADLVLAQAKPAPPPRPRKKQNRLRLLSTVLDTRLRLVFLGFVVLYVIGTAILVWSRGGSLGQAAYAALITELTGNADTGATGVERFVLVVLTLVSIVLIPALTATIVDSVVKARLRVEAGALVEPVADHMVVVGLGDVGTRVIRSLHEQGVEIVALERDPKARGVVVARELGIPVIIGDASRSEMLLSASVANCRALIVASTDDVTNLEIALLGRQAKEDLRVVLRLFDGDFADRVKRAFGINTSRSVSYLAAPAFAAAMLSRQIIATIPVRRRVLLLAEVPVGADSALEHQPVSTVTTDHLVRLLAIRTEDSGASGQVLWRPSDGRPLRRTDRLIVVATRAGLSQLLHETTTPVEVDHSTPYRLLEPWQMPHARATSPEGPQGHPPFGPADIDSTRPA